MTRAYEQAQWNAQTDERLWTEERANVHCMVTRKDGIWQAHDARLWMNRRRERRKDDMGAQPLARWGDMISDETSEEERDHALPPSIGTPPLEPASASSSSR
jgi:hypothetical protein